MPFAWVEQVSCFRDAFVDLGDDARRLLFQEIGDSLLERQFMPLVDVQPSG